MSAQAKILVVDDTPANLKLLGDLLAMKGYAVSTAPNGEEGLARVMSEKPDLVLLDVMMPGMSGYEVCRRIRENAATALLPVVLCTSLDPQQERVKGIEAGADDFLSKPVNQPELFARVKSLLRIKSLLDEVKEWNAKLEQRVSEQLAEVGRLARMKRFLSPQVADLILAGGGEDPLKSHRREITVVFLDLRGFTAFTETADPEEVMGVLREYHAEMGRLIMAHQGTLERFAGDGIMIFFNDPVVLENPAVSAVRMALEMQARFAELGVGWKKRGYELGMGIGIAQGYATLGAIGFEQRWDYGAIGNVTNVAARLCSEANGGQVLVSQRVMGKVEQLVEAEQVGVLSLKGLSRQIQTFNVRALRAV